MVNQELFDKIDALNSKYLSVWEDVCNIESPTNSKQGVDAVGNYFIRMAQALGWQVEVAPFAVSGDAVCITMNPEASLPPVSLSGHIDTVHPVGLFGVPAVHTDEEKIYGPGVADCKGGVVAGFMAMEALAQCGFRTRPIQLILQSDEETSSKGSDKKTVEYMCQKAEGSVAFLNLEPGNGVSGVLSRKGILRCKFHIKGKAAHSSRCVNGASAIAEAAHKILKLEQMKDLHGLTCNCGVIQGGTVGNAVAAECWFIADIRFMNEEQCQEVMRTVQAVAEHTDIEGCSCTVEQISFRPAMSLTETNLQFLDRMNEIFEQYGLPKLAQGMDFGGSDAAYITQKGIPCVDSIGVVGDRVHSVDEFAYKRSLADAAKRIAVVAACI